jgi:hypothetical protein
MKLNRIIIIMLVVVAGATACKKKDDNRSSDTSLTIVRQPAGIAVAINGSSISVQACKQTYQALSGTGISLSDLGISLADAKASVNPPLNELQSIAAGTVKYTVTAENGTTKEYTVQVENTGRSCNQ